MSDNDRTASMSGLLVGNEPLAKVSDVEYSKVQSYFEMLDAVSRLTYQSIYVLDYCKMNFLYVSDNPIFLCGSSREEVMAKGFDFLIEQCKPEEVHARSLKKSIYPIPERVKISKTAFGAPKRVVIFYFQLILRTGDDYDIYKNFLEKRFIACP